MGIGAIGKLTVMFGADMKGFDRAMKNAQRSMNKWGKNMNRIGSSLTRNVTLPVLGLGVAAVKLASDFEESLNKVRVSFGDTSTEVENFAKTTLERFNIAEGSALEMASLFGDMGTSMGQTNQQASQMSMTLVGLAGDLASFKNVQIDVAQTALKGIFTGETEALKNLGVVVTDTVLKQTDYFLSLNKSWNELTQLEKIQIRFNEVLRQTNKAQGDVVKTSDSFANQWRRLQETLKETGAELGKNLIPLANNLVELLREGTQKLNDMTEAQRESLIKWAGLAAILGPVLQAFASLVTIFSKLLPLLVGKGGLVGGILALASAGTTLERSFKDWAMKKWAEYATKVAKAKTETDDFTLSLESLDKIIKKATGTGFRFFEHTPTPKPKPTGDSKRPTDNMPTEKIARLGAVLLDTSRAWRTYYEEMDESSNVWDDASQKLASLNLEIQQNFEGALYGAMTAQENFFDSFIANMKKAIGQMMAMHAAQQITNALFGVATGGLGGGIGGIFGKLLGLHTGGLVTGPTLAMVGEGGGTSISNPEVVAPLDKLKSMMGGGVQQIEVQGRLSGSDIWLSNSKTTNSRLRSV